jgi:hypothetical protein
MDQAPAKFDWIAWHATIPGIPAGWGEPPAAAEAAPAFIPENEPELLAA